LSVRRWWYRTTYRPRRGIFPGDTLLDRLRSQKLITLVFVMDYMQLVFEEARITINVWPIIEMDDNVYHIDDPAYEYTLRTLIGSVVSYAGISLNNDTGLEMLIGPGGLTIAPFLSDIVTPEIMIMTSAVDHEWMVWREGEPPFVGLS
jgi:hypothetical protein